MAINGPRRRDAIFFAVAAVVFWLFSMGRYCEPVYRIVYALPFGDYLRAPVKWHHLTEFSIVVLSAFGLEAAWRIIAEKRVLWARAVLLCLVAAAVVELAAQAKIYCAPHTADTVAGVLPRPIPPDFAEALHFRNCAKIFLAHNLFLIQKGSVKIDCDNFIFSIIFHLD